MIVIRNVRISNDNNCFATTGLKRFVGFEFRLVKLKRDDSQYLQLLTYLINYFVDYKPVINDNQTIAYHSWILKFVFVNGVINLFEAQPDGEGFIEGADYGITLISEQTEECKVQNTTPLFPLFSQMIVISEGVLEGAAIEGVRYSSPQHMTGWWLKTEHYNNDIKTLKTIHYSHLAFERPDIIKYLALSFGFRFLSETNEIWFDKEVLS